MPHLGRWGFNGLSAHENNAPKISAKHRFDVGYHHGTIGSTPSILIIVKREMHCRAVSGSFNITLDGDITHNPAKPALRSLMKCIRSPRLHFYTIHPVRDACACVCIYMCAIHCNKKIYRIKYNDKNYLL